MKKYSLEDISYSLKELSEITKVPESILQEVYNRGVGAYKGNPQSVRLKGSFVKNVKASMNYKLSKEQWAMARVYSFLDGNPKHDNDLRLNEIEEKASKVYESKHGLEEIRTTALRMKCNKIDMELVKAFKTKEQLVEYLKSRDCPALKKLESKYMYDT